MNAITTADFTDLEWDTVQHYANGLTLEEVEAKTGVSKSTVRRWCLIAGVPMRRPSRRPDRDDIAVRQLVEQGLSDWAISNRLRVYINKVRRIREGMQCSSSE